MWSFALAVAFLWRHNSGICVVCKRCVFEACSASSCCPQHSRALRQLGASSGCDLLKCGESPSSVSWLGGVVEHTGKIPSLREKMCRAIISAITPSALTDKMLPVLRPLCGRSHLNSLPPGHTECRQLAANQVAPTRLLPRNGKIRRLRSCYRL